MEGRGPPLLEPTAVVFLELLRCHRANAAVGARDAHCRHAEDRASPPLQVVAKASGRGRHLRVSFSACPRAPTSPALHTAPPSLRPLRDAPQVRGAMMVILCSH
jgi:hypothetical protein